MAAVFIAMSTRPADATARAKMATNAKRPGATAAAIEKRPQGTRSTGRRRSGPDLAINCPATAAATPPAAIDADNKIPNPAFDRPVNRSTSAVATAQLPQKTPKQMNAPAATTRWRCIRALWHVLEADSRCNRDQARNGGQQGGRHAG